MKTERTLTDRIQLWRSLFIGAWALIGVIAVSGFLFERSSASRVFHTDEVLRLATAADGVAMDAENSASNAVLRSDTAAAARYRARSDTLHTAVLVLKELTSDNPAQGRRLASLDTALANWTALNERALSSPGMTATERAEVAFPLFNDIRHRLHEVIAVEAGLRAERIRTNTARSRLVLTVLVLALLVSALAFAYVARAVERSAARLLHEKRVTEEQSSELASQSSQLQDQAAELEEQAAELEQRLQEHQDTHAILERTSAFLDSAVDSSPVGIAFFDDKLRFQQVNAAFSGSSGKAPETYFGHSLEEVVPDLAPVVRPMLERVLKSGKAEPDHAFDLPALSAGGPARRLVATFYPIASSGRAPIGVGCMVVDVTERSQLEEQLRQAQKMEAVGRLAGGIAHDFNNVLTIIQTYAEILIADLPPGAKGIEEIEAIRGAADRATALSRQLLAFSRREVLIPRNVDLNEVVGGLETILKRLLRQGVKLELALDPSPLRVRIDPGQLEQVLMNLAINAVDAMPHGGTLAINTAHCESMPGAEAEGRGRGSCALLTVSDSGTGMTKEVQERLFEPFFTTKPAGQGTGLGLATTYAIVRGAAGEIRVSSVIDKGSDFEVFFPISGRSSSGAHQRVTPPAADIPAHVDECILVAEDEPAIRAALTRVLRSKGYRVLDAGDGQEALRLAAQEPGRIDLLLTDLMMPGMGGKELMQRIRQSRADIRIILMSGYTDDDSLRRELSGAGLAFLQKPFAARAVVAAVRGLLDEA